MYPLANKPLWIYANGEILRLSVVDIDSLGGWNNPYLISAIHIKSDIHFFGLNLQGFQDINRINPVILSNVTGVAEFSGFLHQ